jgi:hypothetical protein
MSKRAGLIAVGAVLAVVGAAAVVSAGSDPETLECGGGYVAHGSVFGGADSESTRATPMAAAAAAIEGMQGLSDEVELVEIPASKDNAASVDSMRVAARAGGKTVMVLELAEGSDGWDVESTVAC